MIKKSNYLILGLFLLLVLTKCTPSELEELNPYQYYFGKFDEVPIVTVPTREVLSIPEFGAGGFKPGATQVPFFEDIFSGPSKGEITDTNIILLNALYQKQDSGTTINLSDEELENLLIPGAEIDTKLIEILSNVMDDPKLRELLSELTLPTLDGVPFYNPDARVLKTRTSTLKEARVNSTSPETLVTPCKQAAEESFLIRLELLNMEMETTLNSNQISQENELKKLDSLSASLQTLFDDSLSNTRDNLLLTVLELNRTAAQLYEQNIINENEFIGLKTFITVWVVKASLDLNELKKQQDAAIIYFKQESIDQLENIQIQFLNQLNQNYQVSLTSLNKIYEEVLENCHNQGGGSD